jgi:ATP-binding cassette subfamily C protein CydCD
VTDVLTGTAELTVAGALPARTAEARRADGALTRIASRAATATAYQSDHLSPFLIKFI